MAPLITENIDRIIAACEKHHVKNLYVFGSALREDDFNEESDVDFLYNFKKKKYPWMIMQNYWSEAYTYSQL